MEDLTGVARKASRVRSRFDGRNRKTDSWIASLLSRRRIKKTPRSASIGSGKVCSKAYEDLLGNPIDRSRGESLRSSGRATRRSSPRRQRPLEFGREGDILGFEETDRGQGEQRRRRDGSAALGDPQRA